MEKALRVGVAVFAGIGVLFVILTFVGMFSAAPMESGVPLDASGEPGVSTDAQQLEDAEEIADEIEDRRAATVEKNLANAFAQFDAFTTGAVSYEIHEGVVLLHGAVGNMQSLEEAGLLASEASDGMPVENNIIVKDINPKWQ